MKAQRESKSIIVQLDREDLMMYMIRLTTRIMDSDEILIRMHEWEQSNNYEDYQKMMDILELEHCYVVMHEKTALAFSDQLVSEIFGHDDIELIEQGKAKLEEAKERHLKIARICGFCGNSYISEKRGHDECV